MKMFCRITQKDYTQKNWNHIPGYSTLAICCGILSNFHLLLLTTLEPTFTKVEII